MDYLAYEGWSTNKTALGVANTNSLLETEANYNATRAAMVD
jgi:hypothetical protein